MEKRNFPCISIVGMAGVGKTTIGKLLAQKLGWAFMDSDKIIESLYASRLQNLTDMLGKEAFLNLEKDVICALNVQRCVLATGGSVVHREEAIRYLKNLGPVIYLSAPWHVIEERIDQNPERGIAIGPGEKLEDLYNERKKLYKIAADISWNAWPSGPEECAETLYKELCAKYGYQ